MTQSLLAQELDTIDNKFGYRNQFEFVEVEGGLTIPIGNLKNTMNVSPNVGLWIRKQLANNTIRSFGFSVNFPKRKDFSYANADFISHTKSFSGMVGLKMDKVYAINKRKYIDLQWSSVLGYGFYFYDDARARADYAEWPADKKEAEDKPSFVKPFSTFHLGQGLQLRIRDFGIQARYNYSPYSLFTNTIDGSFGAHSVTVGLFYRQ
ncbi:hypothetical protein C4F49_11645 [Sphingobacterium sp. KB22]|uniref:Outer membrane protein beta-barrel domain-containing protein n=2 Tax=Sphingobacterium hungaricum TaxID=2082723 RepID=A0A928UX63_9SPHI|nr:hypothetical protein [Sphingobacterium hungaricum]